MGETLDQRALRISRSPCLLTMAELDAWCPPEDPVWLSRCSEPARAGWALNWLTVDASAIVVRASFGDPLGQPMVRARAEDRDYWIPAALTLRMLCSATAAFATWFGDGEPGDRIQFLVRRRVTELLSGGAPLDRTDPDSDIPDGALADSFVSVRGSRHVAFVGATAALTAPDLKRRLDAQTHELTAVDAAEISERCRGVQRDAEILRVLVYGGPFILGSTQTAGPVRVHLSEFEALIADGVSARTPNLHWSFLSDFQTQRCLAPGTDLLDAWRLWRQYGTFNPGCLPDLVVMPDPTPDETAWKSAAAWDPIEAVLHAAGLPTRSGFARSYLDQDGGVLIADGYIVLVNTSPPLVLIVANQADADPSPVDIPQFVADGLRCTLRSTPALATLIDVLEAPVVAHLFLADRPADGDDWPFALMSDDDGNYGLGLPSNWVTLMQDDPKTCHEALGQVFLHLVNQAAHASHADLKETAELTELAYEEWKAAPHVGIVRSVARYHTEPATTISPGAAPSRAARAHLQHLLAPAVRKARIPPGLYRGDAARHVLADATPLVEAVLDTVISPWGPDALERVLAMLNARHHAAHAARSNALLGLEAPWGLALRDSLQNELAELGCRSLELLVEWIIRRSPQGRVTPDLLDIEVAEAASGLCLDLAIRRSSAQFGFETGTVVVGPAGTLHAGPLPRVNADEGIDLDAYMTAVRQHPFRVGPSTSDVAPPRPETLEGELPFVPLASQAVPHRLIKLDEELRRAIGTGIDGIRAVLATAAEWESAPDGLVRANVDDLLSSASAWSRVAPMQVRRAIERLTLAPNALSVEPFEYWETDARSHRMMARPLVRNPNGTLLFAPAVVAATHQVFMDHFLDGRLPWPTHGLPTQLLDALSNYRKIAGADLEREATRISAAITNHSVAHLDQKEALVHGLDIPGEIDLLILAQHHRLWVAETKDLGIALTPRVIRKRGARFEGKGGYNAVLAKKVRAVEAAVTTTLRLLGSLKAEVTAVRGLFISRSVEPAAFRREPEHLFVLVHDLPSLLSDPSPPETGQYTIGDHQLAV